MSLLELHNIALLADGKRLLQGINVAVERGELVVVLGPNGAGKSTLLKVASGELIADSGQISFLSQPLSALSLVDKACNMAVLPQQSSLDFAFTVREVVALARIPHHTGAVFDNRIVDYALRLMDVGQFAGQCYPHLSGGEKQRVQLARVLAQVWGEAGLLLLDEPTAALDFSHQQHIMQVLKQRVQQGSGVLMVLHDVNLAASFADRVIIMQQGEVCAAGDPQQILCESLLASVFGLPFYRVVHPETGKAMFVN